MSVIASTASTAKDVVIGVIAVIVGFLVRLAWRLNERVARIEQRLEDLRNGRH